mmetsp:Transcript_17722/g.30152  ORF Transcript_17722/g.30152 Transcript_17722/m.30152 type:complete len:455 (-) Transcript_17722:10-1374(-)
MSGEKEVYVDFSDVEIEEEVVESGATGDDVVLSPLDKIQSHLPPTVNEWIDKFMQSYAQYRKQYLVALAVIAIVIAVAIIAGLLFLSGGSEDGGFDFDAKTDSFTAGPITLPYSGSWSGSLSDIDRPEGVISIHQVDISLVDENDAPISILTAFVNALHITNQDGDLIAGVEGEVDEDALKLPLPYAVQVNSVDKWTLHGEITNVWGMVANAEIDVFVKYTVVYSDSDTDNYTPVYWSVVGDTETHDVSKSDCTTYNDDGCTFVTEETWNHGDSVLTSISGRLSIGGTKITLENIDADEIIAEIVPVYVDEGYIDSIPVVYGAYELTDGTKLRVTSYYDTDFEYNDVVSKFYIWSTNEASADSISVAESSVELSSYQSSEYISSYSSYTSEEEEPSSSPSPSPSSSSSEVRNSHSSSKSLTPAATISSTPSSSPVPSSVPTSSPVPSPEPSPEE